jgi:hypothetical protein
MPRRISPKKSMLQSITRVCIKGKGAASTPAKSDIRLANRRFWLYFFGVLERRANLSSQLRHRIHPLRGDFD